MEKRKTLALGDAATLLHAILFAYQKANRDILGPGAAIFVDPILDIINKISEKYDIAMIQGSDIDEVLENYVKILMMSGLAKRATIEKQPQRGYILKIEGCAFNQNNEVHELLTPKDVTCPWAMIAMAIYSKYTGRKIQVTDSTFEKDLSVTKIKERTEEEER